ncbi:MAG: FAD-binding oxidoreductase [Actinomycetota bacterium]|nr:FAD-binding oxidoreductase [Actinomycetota bacterium]
MTAPPADLLDALRQVVGDRHVLTDPAVTQGYCTDWTGRYRSGACPVVRPGDAAEVATVVALHAQAGVPLVVQGGNTGLVGGGVPHAAAHVLSTTRLTRLDEIDEEQATVTVGAGVTLAELQQVARARGLRTGVDLASRDSATVGGMVATNAGGLRVLRFGHVRAQLTGIEAALGTGAVVSHLDVPYKDNTGYDLAGLLCGSEGTLGVVTAATVRLYPLADQAATALVGFDDGAAAVAFITALRHHVPTLEAVELMTAAGARLVSRSADVPLPLATEPAFLVLLEATGGHATSDVEAALEALAPAYTHATIAMDEAGRRSLWRLREGHPVAISERGAAHKLDVTLPMRALSAFIDEAPRALARALPGAEVYLFGHAADGNVHVNVVGTSPHDPRATDVVFGLVAEHGGSISSEHGIGVAKREWLHLNRSQAELETFGRLKALFDPAGVLNPGVLIPSTVEVAGAVA